MQRIRNAVIIIVLCLIGVGIKTNKPASNLGLNMPNAAELKDAVAGHRASRPGLNLRDGSDDTLRDAVAGHAAGTPAGLGTNTLADVSPPPRGSGNGGFSSLSNNPRGVAPPPLSPSGPQ